MSRTSGFDERFTQFYLAEFPALARYCQRLVDHPALAEDIAQEALVRMLSRWLSIRNPRAYAYLTATNLVRAHWRRERTHRATIDLLDHPDADRSVDTDPELRHIVESLPQRLRGPVILHYYVGYPVEEVARLLHRPLNTVKSQLAKARGLLRDQLTDLDAV
jgi:RNA polymerase sigma-70 factor, ECF subfamily